MKSLARNVSVSLAVQRVVGQRSSRHLELDLLLIIFLGAKQRGAGRMCCTQRPHTGSAAQAGGPAAVSIMGCPEQAPPEHGARCSEHTQPDAWPRDESGKQQPCQVGRLQQL